MQPKTVLVTGSSRGIGKAIAFAFGKAGYRVVLNASRSQDALLQTQSELETMGVPVMSILADVSDYTACQSMFAQIRERFGTIDVLVNNAGISQISLFTDLSPADWQHLLAVNLGSVLNCTHLAVPDMVHNKSGNIINISSMWGSVGASCEAVYAASKGGIHAFTRSMAKELGPSQIRVNAIACGVIDTQMNACFSEEERTMLAEETALMRFGKPEEVANLSLFLVSEQAGFLTGQIITLDGGML